MHRVISTLHFYIGQRNAFTAQRCLLLIAMACLVGCQSAGYNDTVYPYVIRSEALQQHAPKRLVISHENFGTPSKTYLQPYESKIDNKVRDRLEGGGYTIVENTEFRKYWRENVRKYGSPYNPTTSQLNTEAFQQVVQATFKKLSEGGGVDAIVFTDLVEQPVVFQGNNNRLAKWHGVSRKPGIKGSGGVSADFDWSQTAPAISLRVIIYATDGTLLFKSIGGLEVARYINSRQSDGRFVRREKLFTKQSHIDQGVNLALHPFIVAKDYSQK